MQDHVTPTFALDANGDVLIWNRACEQPTNFKAENMIGTKNHWQAFYDEKRDFLADLLLKNNTDKISELYYLQIDSTINEHLLRVENWC